MITTSYARILAHCYFEHATFEQRLQALQDDFDKRWSETSIVYHIEGADYPPLMQSALDAVMFVHLPDKSAQDTIRKMAADALCREVYDHFHAAQTVHHTGFIQFGFTSDASVEAFKSAHGSNLPTLTRVK